MNAKQLAEQHVWIVHIEAKKLRGKSDGSLNNRVDLWGPGFLALVEAANKWRAFKRKHQTARFDYFAGQRVKWRMLDVLRRYKELPQEPEDLEDRGGEKGGGFWRWIDNLPAVAIENHSDHIRGLVHRLPAAERQAVSLSFGIGTLNRLAVSEIAAKMKKPPATIRELIESGIMRLRWDAVRGRA